MSGQDSTEQRVAQHYGRSDLEQAILDALVAAGKDVGRLVPDDLSSFDEFHSGGRQATVELAAQVGFKPNMYILDVGCGIGGAARYFAQTHGCRVAGIDLTEDYVRTADALTRRVGLAGRIVYQQASALALPFEPGTFDGAYMMHVGMNVEDKPTLFAEIRRVLKAGTLFALYDVMQTGDGELAYPLHWAATPQTSFVDSAAEYHRALEAAGFEVTRERSRRELAREVLRGARAAMANGLPPLGTHILMKGDVAQKLANAERNVEKGLMAPIEFICRAR
jgi:ubiquinone/menaquinone biosynthesis C-methylase UbiE